MKNAVTCLMAGLCLVAPEAVIAFVLQPSITTRQSASSTSLSAGPEVKINPWDMGAAQLERPVKVQGGALRTWSYPTEVNEVFVHLVTEGPPEGNPCKASIDLNQGPNNTPQKIEIYSGKGRLRQVRFMMETPGESNAVFIRNKSPIEFPFEARVSEELTDILEYNMTPEILIQGSNSVNSYKLPPEVSFVKVVLRTDGRPLNAIVELVQGPNAPKYTFEIYTEDGALRPFCCVMETPGAGNTVRIVNTAPMEFPLVASVGPAVTDKAMAAAFLAPQAPR